ncbi:uracil-DNA glycosylase [Blattabacterium cuenoti]|uniref:uracil-DNA glycosylase n=1 Tax=Blattabacterium cuenoti TaxID=1653831 RepID=UPI00163CE69D|nr:uracil-DNA glycosylase [Blattabacterium cuenoti]
MKKEMLIKKFLNINDDWFFFIKEEWDKPYFQKLLKFLRIEYKNYVCFPEKKNIFSSFNYCSFFKLKVVILGQDPYYKDNQADGLSFSVPNGVAFPPSLKNIFIEVNNCFQQKSFPISGSLIFWATQGVLLLNSILTVRKGLPGSHRNKGWEIFTDKIIRIISDKKKHIVFLLWGELAKKKASIINFNNHYILKTSHPSPISANFGFLGSRHFFKTNQFLKKIGKKPIMW